MAFQKKVQSYLSLFFSLFILFDSILRKEIQAKLETRNAIFRFFNQVLLDFRMIAI